MELSTSLITQIGQSAISVRRCESHGSDFARTYRTFAINFRNMPNYPTPRFDRPKFRRNFRAVFRDTNIRKTLGGMTTHRRDLSKKLYNFLSRSRYV